MKIKTPSFLLFIFCLISLPAFLKAQDNKAQDNTHCVVKKSPYRLSMDSGKKIYTLQCLTCHQVDGLGAPPMNPPLNNKQVSGDKTKLIGILIKGHATHDEIDGVKYQHVISPHPEMTDQEIADVLTYIRNSFGNKASSVRVPDVKSVRSKMK